MFHQAECGCESAANKNNVMNNNSQISKDTLKYGYPLNRDTCINPTYLRGFSDTHHGIDLASLSNEKCEIIAVTQGEVIEAAFSI